MEIIEGLRQGVIFYLIFMSSLCLRAGVQAWVGEKMGDPLPRLEGRVSFNPVVHMDWVGSVLFPLGAIVLPIFLGGSLLPLFGWTKPIHLALMEPQRRRRVEVTVALSGILFYMGISLVLAVGGGVISRLSPDLLSLFWIAIQINVTLAVFHLLPLPPLDGGVLARYAFNLSDEFYEALSRYSLFIFLGLILFPVTRQLIFGLIMLLQWPFYQLLIMVG